MQTGLAAETHRLQSGKSCSRPPTLIVSQIAGFCKVFLQNLLQDSAKLSCLDKDSVCKPAEEKSPAGSLNLILIERTLLISRFRTV